MHALAAISDLIMQTHEALRKAIADAVISGDTELAGALAEQHAEAAGEETYKRLKQNEDNNAAAQHRV